MTPSEYKAQYESLTINLGGGQTTTVKVSNYRLGKPKDGGAARKLLLDKVGKGVKDFELKVGPDGNLKAVDAKVTETSAFRVALASPYTGKGAPEHCQAVLQLVHHFDIETDLQKYADTHLGLDCNGFVGNYLWHRNHPWTSVGRGEDDLDGPDMRIDGFFDVRRKDRVKNWSDINTTLLYLLIRTTENGDIIVRNEGDPIGHIVISNTGTAPRTDPNSDHVSFSVVESTASHAPPGLSVNWYSWVAEKHAGTAKAIFKVDRGIDIHGANKQIWFMIVQVQPVKET